tara:strand:- start:152 stop:277 length:126 start_codon:yes stop_codon:yes gene_type:complete
VKDVDGGIPERRKQNDASYHEALCTLHRYNKKESEQKGIDG